MVGAAPYDWTVADNLLRSLWAEPAVVDPPPRTWRDWALFGVLVPAALLEGLLRSDVIWRPVAIVMAVGFLLTLLWRRSHPFAATALAFGTATVVTLAGLLAGAGGTVGLHTSAAVLLLPYAQFRWGSGRRSAQALAIIMLAAITGTIEDYTGVAAAIGGFVILLFAVTMGALVRHLTESRQRGLDDVKRREREQIARELHDTVAHHVSAIIIQAQAGRTVADTRPDAAVAALDSIEEEASRTLNEMRSIVGSLRQHPADLAPQPRVRDIVRLAANAAGPVAIDVQLDGDVTELIPAVDTAVYRLAQEAITNARRHARGATRIDVSVATHDDLVRLTVRDDGQAPAKRRAPTPGYGLVGMSERVMLLGGTFHAGPDPGGGWVVAVELPARGLVQREGRRRPCAP
ncbi:histidine kinase [soil metagenome]